MARSENSDRCDMPDDVRVLQDRIKELQHLLEEHQHVEQELRQQVSTHRQIADSMLGGLIRVELDGSISDANAESLRVLGLSFDELTQKYVADFDPVTFNEDGTPLPSEDYPVSRCLRTGEPQPPVIIGVRRPAGDVTWAAYSAAPLIDARTGKMTAAVITFIDVTNQKRAQLTLRKTEENYRGLFEKNPQPMMIYDRRTMKFLAVNEATIKHYGYSRDEFMAMDALAIRPPEEIPALLAHLKNLNNELVNAGVWRHRKKDGTTFEAEITVCGIEFAGVPAWLVMINDVTLRRRAEAALRASEEHYRRLVEGVRLIAWEYEPATRRFVFVSNQAEEILGYPLQQWLEPEFWYNHLHPEDRESVSQFSRQHVARGENHEFEYRMVHARGGDVWFRDITTVELENGRPVRLRGVLVDITDRKRAEAALQQLTETQRRTLNELDHRVRNNLAALSALIDISRLSESTVSSFAESIRRRVYAMATVHSLLSRTRGVPVDLCELLEALLPVDLQESMHVDGPDVLVMPRQVSAMGMMLQELIANSLKYGALRDPAGRVNVVWTCQPLPNGARRLDLQWQERGGPQPHPSPPVGQGTELIHGLVRTELGGTAELTFPPTGAAHRFTLMLDALQADPSTLG